MKKILVALLILALTCSLVGCKRINEAKESILNKVSPKHIAYNEALKLIENGEYEAAQAVFKELGDFKDSEEHLGRFHYVFVSAYAESVDTYNGETKESTTQVKLSLNDKGLIEKCEMTYDDENEIVVFYYDDKGNLIKEDYTSTFESSTSEYEYDENGNKIKETTHNKDYTHIGEYTYDKNGNLLKSVSTYSTYNSSSIDIFEYTYDSHNNEIKRKVTYSHNSNDYNYTDTHTRTTENTYDANDNLIKKVEFNSFGEVDSTYEYEYDINDNMVKMSVTTLYSTSTYEYEYNADGNLVKKSYTSSDDYSKQNEYTYDKSGNIIKEVITYSYGDTYTDEYEYDEHGNIVKGFSTHSNNNSSSTTTFTVEYKLVYISVDMTAEEYEALLDYIFDFRPHATID